MEEVKNGNHQNHEHCEMCSHHDCGKNKMCGMGFWGYNMKHRVLHGLIVSSYVLLFCPNLWGRAGEWMLIGKNRLR